MVSPAYTVCRPLDGILPGFARHFFKAPQIVRLLRAFSQGLTGDRLRLYFNNFAAIPVVLPPPAEQRRIAEILTAIDELIDATHAVIEQSRKVKQGLLQQLLSRGVGHTRFELTEIGRRPASWTVLSLGDCLAGIVAGKSPSCSNRPAASNEWGVLKVSAIGFGKFMERENKALPRDYSVDPRLVVRGGDVLVTRANTKELVGACCRVPAGEYRLMLCDKTLRLEPNHRLIARFLSYALATPRARRYFGEEATGSSRSMKNISQKTVRGLRIAVPSRNEQQEIADIVDEADRFLSSHEATAWQATQLRRGLVQALLTGRIRVRGA